MWKIGTESPTRGRRMCRRHQLRLTQLHRQRASGTLPAAALSDGALALTAFAAAFAAAMAGGIVARHRFLPSRLIPQLGDGLREVNLDSSVVYERSVHLEVCLRTRFDFLELDERIIERVARLIIANDRAFLDSAEAREDQLEVFVLRDRVELADEEHILGRRQVGVRQIAKHLEDLRA